MTLAEHGYDVGHLEEPPPVDRNRLAAPPFAGDDVN
jgi:hypothetical protein